MKAYAFLSVLIVLGASGGDAVGKPTSRELLDLLDDKAIIMVGVTRAGSEENLARALAAMWKAKFEPMGVPPCVLEIYAKIERLVVSVESVDIVTADGELRTASANENADLFWAVRGAGPEFFAIVTGYRLRLQPLPRAITTSVRTYGIDDAVSVASWMNAAMAEVPRNVEFTAMISNAPPSLLSCLWLGRLSQSGDCP